MNTLKEQLARWIDEDREQIIGFLCDFVRAKSPNPPGDTTRAAASVVSPGGFGLLARTKSHKKAMIVSRSSSIHFASWRFTSSMAAPSSRGEVAESIHRRRLDRRADRPDYSRTS